MKTIDVVIKSMLRNKAKVLLNVVLISIIVSSSTFILNFLFNVTFISNNVFFSVSILNVLKQFIWFLALITVLYSILMLQGVSKTIIALKYRDVGLMKAIGGDTDLINTYVLLEIFFTTFLSYVFSFLLVFPLNAIIANFYRRLEYISYLKINFPMLFSLYFMFFVFIYFFSQRETNHVIDLETTKTFTLELPKKSIYELSLFNSLFARFSFSLKIAAKSLERTRRKFGNIFLTLLIVFLFFTLYFYGGYLVKYTLMGYVENAYSENIVAIGYSPLLDKYVDLMESYKERYSEEPYFDFLKKEYLISEEIVNVFSEIEGIEIVDSRLIFKGKVLEKPYIEIAEYRQIGNHRDHDALIIGVNVSQLVSSWYLEGEFIGEKDSGMVVIGGFSGL